YFLFSAVCTDWKASADNFTHCGQIGFDSVQVLGASVHEAESGNDFIVNDKRAGFVGQVIDLLEEAFFRFHDPEVADNWFDQHGCHLIAPYFQSGFKWFNVVKRNGNYLSGNALGN